MRPAYAAYCCATENLKRGLTTHIEYCSLRSMEQTPIQKQRLYNIDALRIICMLFVCLLHVGGTYGGMSAIEGMAGKILLAFLIILSDVAVNCFIMITAYVAGGREWKVSRYLKLYSQVAFYCVGFSVVGWLISSYSASGGDVTLHMLLRWNLPVPFASAYWYFVAYSALFLLAPFIDKLLRILNRKQFVLLLAVTVGVIVIQGIIPPYQDKVSGYSLYWMVCMYLLGYYLRCYPLHLTRCGGWLGVIGCGCAGTALFGLAVYGKKHGYEIPNFAIGYTQPFVVIESILLFSLFAQFNVRGARARGWISRLAPLSFGVYLVHEHPAFSPYVKEACMTLYSWIGYNCATVLMASVITYILASMVDFARLALFHRLRVEQGAVTLGDKVESGIKRIFCRYFP